MARSLRLEYSGALYHVTSRDNVSIKVDNIDISYFHVDVIKTGTDHGLGNCWSDRNYALGSEKFAAQIEAALGRRASRGKPRRPRS